MCIPNVHVTFGKCPVGVLPSNKAYAVTLQFFVNDKEA